MRRLRRLWWGLPALLAVLAAVGYVRMGGDWPFGLADREARAPDTPPQAGRGRASSPAQEPVTFRAVRDGERIVVSGFISGEEMRKALLEEAKQAVPDAVVSDEAKVSAKAPPGLHEAAAFGLRQLARLPSGAVTVQEDRIEITGRAPDLEAYRAIAGAVQTPPHGFRLDLAGLIPPLARPYTWSATSSEGGIALDGHVPSENARRAVAAAVREAFPDKELHDRLQPASGAPSGVDFEAAARFALTQLAQLGGGTADLVDATLSLRGDVTDRDTLAGVRAAMQGGLPPGLQPGSVAIVLSRPSPYTFRARREAGALTLTGYYPDQETRAAIQGLIRGRFFSEQVVDKLRAAEGAPPNYLAGVSFGLEHLARLATGEVAVSGASLQLSGEALYAQTAEQTARAVPNLSVRGWTGKADIRVRPSEKADAAGLRSLQP